VISVCSLLALRSLSAGGVGQHEQRDRKPMGLQQMRQEVGEGFCTIFGSTWLRWSMIVETFRLVAYMIVAACLSLANGAAGDPQQSGQVRLRQANAQASHEHDLPEGIVALPNSRAPDRSAASSACSLPSS
jgi:hypothetical protein